MGEQERKKTELLKDLENINEEMNVWNFLLLNGDTNISLKMNKFITKRKSIANKGSLRNG